MSDYNLSVPHLDFNKMKGFGKKQSMSTQRVTPIENQNQFFYKRPILTDRNTLLPDFDENMFLAISPRKTHTKIISSKIKSRKTNSFS